MLAKAKHPVAWAMWVDELSDAHEHLGDLIDQIVAESSLDEDEFRILLGHVVSHLNRAWHGRDDPRLDDLSAEAFSERSRFPVDLVPVG